MLPGEILLCIRKQDLTVTPIYSFFMLPDADYDRALAQVTNRSDDAGLDGDVEGSEKPLPKQLREQLRFKLNQVLEGRLLQTFDISFARNVVTMEWVPIKGNNGQHFERLPVARD